MTRILQKLSGWSRAAVLFSVVWIACVVGVAAYERYVTIGNVSGPLALFRDHSSLVFHHVDTRAEVVSFWFLSQRFWTVLLLPVCITWAIAALAPAVAWVRAGFATSALTPSDDLGRSAEQLISDMQQLIGGSPTNPAFNTLTAMRALHKFACVLVVVSRQADKQSKRVVGLTWALLLLTAVLLVITWIHAQ